ncbi:MAG TPA: GNAT family N-acetyltransferase, partial [Desulfosarcina sp.]|nr:GNAT family N-acetyltransferase [Desulfosarcina sp.]
MITRHWLRGYLRGRGLGSALYEAVREHCLAAGMQCLYLASEPDDTALIADERTLEQNRKRLRFHEYYGVRPVANTVYHLPLGETPTHAYLLFDHLGRNQKLRLADARRAVRWILETRMRRIDVATASWNGLTKRAYILLSAHMINFKQGACMQT